MAPELGLFLDKCYYDAYNEQVRAIERSICRVATAAPVHATGGRLSPPLVSHRLPRMLSVRAAVSQAAARGHALGPDASFRVPPLTLLLLLLPPCAVGQPAAQAPGSGGLQGGGGGVQGKSQVCSLPGATALQHPRSWLALDMHTALWWPMR